MHRQGKASAALLSAHILADLATRKQRADMQQTFFICLQLNIVDSSMVGVQGAVLISNSTVTITRSNFTGNAGMTAGALLIEVPSWLM